MYTHYESAVSGGISTTGSPISQLKRSICSSRVVVPVKPSNHIHPQPLPLDPVHIRQSTSMNIDMALATSYKPVLVCIAKVGLLMIFHYTSAPFLFITERYAFIVAILYVDKWLSYEYIVNTNSCVSIIAGSLLVHELRDTGISERIHGPVAHTILLSLLVAMNALVLMLGENHAFLYTTNTKTNTIPDTIDDDADKKNRQPVHSAHHASKFTAGALLCVICNSTLLFLLCTCAIPTSAHDPFLNNLRVWSFMALSLTWLYTVNYRDLRYSTVSKFTPCVLRFSCILFITPLPFAIGGVLFMSCSLAAIHAFLQKQHKELLLPCLFTQDHVHAQPTHHTDKATVVNREPQQGLTMSYRTPILLPDSDALSLIATNAAGSAAFGASSFVNPNTTSFGGSGVAFGVENTSNSLQGTEDDTAVIDYTLLFEQVLNEQKV
jgi:hypothetical protein